MLVVSKSFIVRESLKHCFEEYFNDYKISVERDLQNVDLEAAHVLFVDISEEDIQDIISIKKNNKDIKVVIFDQNKKEEKYVEAIRNNIEGYIAEIEEKEELVGIMRKIMRNNKKYYDASLLEKSVTNFYGTFDNVAKLTSREKEILNEVKKGYTNKEISNCLYITEHTVKKHITNILFKLDMRNRKDLIVSCIN